MKAHVKAGDAHQAGRVLDRMEQARIQPDCVTYTILLNIHVKAGDAEQAESRSG